MAYKEFIFETKRRDYYVALFDILRRVANDLVVLQFDAIRKLEGTINFPEYAEKITKNLNGTQFDWDEWTRVMSETLEIVNLLIVTPDSNFKLESVNYKNLENCVSFYIECVDSNIWSVFARDEGTLELIDHFFRKIIH